VCPVRGVTDVMVSHHVMSGNALTQCKAQVWSTLSPFSPPTLPRLLLNIVPPNHGHICCCARPDRCASEAPADLHTLTCTHTAAPPPTLCLHAPDTLTLACPRLPSPVLARPRSHSPARTCTRPPAPALACPCLHPPSPACTCPALAGPHQPLPARLRHAAYSPLTPASSTCLCACTPPCRPACSLLRTPTVSHTTSFGPRAFNLDLASDTEPGTNFAHVFTLDGAFGSAHACDASLSLGAGTPLNAGPPLNAGSPCARMPCSPPCNTATLACSQCCALTTTATAALAACERKCGWQVRIRARVGPRPRTCHALRCRQGPVHAPRRRHAPTACDGRGAPAQRALRPAHHCCRRQHNTTTWRGLLCRTRCQPAFGGCQWRSFSTGVHV
jgi:hypothetical protein